MGRTLTLRLPIPITPPRQQSLARGLIFLNLRTFATESVRNGLNVFYVQSLLGHSSLTMTRIYAEQVSSEDAIKAYKPIVT